MFARAYPISQNHLKNAQYIHYFSSYHFILFDFKFKKSILYHNLIFHIFIYIEFLMHQLLIVVMQTGVHHKDR